MVFMSMLLTGGGLADQVTLVGANNPSIDLPAIQAAVNAPNRTVYLDGIFDIGPMGQVLINVQNLTLEGVATGATIKGGFYPITTLNVPPGIPPSAAKNITVRNIHFEGWQGFAIYHMGVAAEDNFTLVEGNTFTNPRVGNAPPFAQGVHYCTGGGSAEIKNNTFINLTSLAVSTHALTLHPEDHLLVEGNTVIDSHYSAIVVDVWDKTLVEFDNGPVIIRNNEIRVASTLLNPYPSIIAIGYGYGEGISNAVVEGNVISGWGAVGVMDGYYGRNRKIVNNDLSGLTTWEGAIVHMGRDSLIAGNILGPTDKAFAAAMGMPWMAMGITIISQQPNLAWPKTLPVTGNVIMNNDFRLTGLTGWGYDAAGGIITPGSVMLMSTADWGWVGAEVTNNLVKEVGRFPEDTGGPKQHILELPVHARHNRIVGHAADEYALLEAANPGIGQKIKESGAKYMELLLNKQAFDKELLKEMEQH